MLSMDSKEMRLMYKAFCEWYEKTLAFIKSDNGENRPCNVVDKGLFESTIYLDGASEIEVRVVPTECLIDDSRRRKRALKRVSEGIADEGVEELFG